MIEELIKKVNFHEGDVSYYSGIVKDFVGKDSEIKSNIMFPGIFFDNYSLYEEVLRNTQGKGLGFTIWATCVYLDKIFGSIKTDSELRRNKMLMKGKRDSDGTRVSLSINDILEKDVAVCTERATFMHNILVLSGIKSNLVCGYLNSEGHAYVLFQSKRSKALLDVTNFVHYTREGKMYGEPILVFISEEEYETIVTGGKYKLDIGNLVSKRIPENDLNFIYEGNVFR